MPRDFQEGCIMLLQDKRHEDLGRHGKFFNLWLWPYVINEKCSKLSNTYHLEIYKDNELSILSMEGILRIFFHHEKGDSLYKKPSISYFIFEFVSLQHRRSFISLVVYFQHDLISIVALLISGSIEPLFKYLSRHYNNQTLTP